MQETGRPSNATSLFVCSVCEKGFWFEKSLKAHLEIDAQCKAKKKKEEEEQGRRAEIAIVVEELETDYEGALIIDESAACLDDDDTDIVTEDSLYKDFIKSQSLLRKNNSLISLMDSGGEQDKENDAKEVWRPWN